MCYIGAVSACESPLNAYLCVFSDVVTIISINIMNVKEKVMEELL